MTYEDILNAIFSQGSAYGPSPCEWPDGPMIAPSGPALAPANPSPRQGKGKARPTCGICGLSFTGSLESASLSLRLANKLKERFASDGSMEYKETWKRKATPSGFLYWAHTASGRRISDKDFSGWPSPMACDDGQHGHHGEWSTSQCNLHCVALGKGKQMDGTVIPAALAGWPSPRATDGSHGGPNQAGGALPADANLTGWGTPSSRDHKDGASDETVPENGLLGRQVWASGPPTPSSSAVTAKRGESLRLNPYFVAWLMGVPKDYFEIILSSGSLSRAKSVTVSPS